MKLLNQLVWSALTCREDLAAVVSLDRSAHCVGSARRLATATVTEWLVDFHHSSSGEFVSVCVGTRL